jgi:RNA polymerase sigma factor (sigma-70 family)
LFVLAAVPSPAPRPSYAGGPARAPQAAATEGLYERHAAKILGYCLHQLGSREEAEDAVQTTFMNAFRALGRGVVPEAESAWLFKIAENVCLSRRRSSWRRGRIESPSDFDVIEEVVPGPSRQRDELIGIEDALASMPEQQRRAILLREWQGLSYREISDELEVSQSAVETLIFRARRSLAQGLEHPELLKRPKRKGLRRALHAIDLGTLAAAAKTLLAGSAAVKATAVAVAVTAAATAGNVTPKLEGHSPQPARISALSTPVAAGSATPAAASTPSGAAFHDELAARPVAVASTNAAEGAPVGQRPAASSGTAAPRIAPVAVAPSAPTQAPAATPQAEPAVSPATAEAAAEAPLAEAPIAAPTPAAQPSHAEPAPVEPAIVEQATPKQRSPYAAPLLPAPEPIAPVITVSTSDVTSSIAAPAPEPVVGSVGIVTTPVPAPTAQPSGGSLLGGN